MTNPLKQQARYVLCNFPDDRHASPTSRLHCLLLVPLHALLRNAASAPTQRRRDAARRHPARLQSEGCRPGGRCCLAV